MKQLYDVNAFDCSRITARNYSTSFSFGIRLFKKKYRPAIYAIYGFVRFADEIVDTFSDINQKETLDKFKKDTAEAFMSGFSSNPILHSFQKIVKIYDINEEYITAFLKSMEMDLTKKTYSEREIRDYIYGSAEVVGLMCLKVFYKGRPNEFDKLTYPARKLGEAFQKINFLRDIRSDYLDNGRCYFPGIDFDNFTVEQKRKIENNISDDFTEASAGISKLNSDVRLGIFLAYNYYVQLLKKICKTSPQQLLNQRYRVSNLIKVFILIKSWVYFKLGMI
jgi:phytoene/squalene synthetase